MYPVEAPEPCHLVELALEVEDPRSVVDSLTQSVSEQPPANWQVVWDERFLDPSGPREVAPEPGSIRVVAFMHYLDLERPLMCSLGDLQLPASSTLPERLSWIRYVTP